MRFFYFATALFFSLPISIAYAQTVVPSGSDLFEIVNNSVSGDTLVLEGDAYPQSVEIIGKTLTFKGAPGGTALGGERGTSMLYLDQGSDVTLVDTHFDWNDPERAAVFVDGGTLRMSGGSISGDLRFGIYATAGASVFIDDVEFSSMNNGIYLLDQGNITVSMAEFSGLYGPSISAFGAPIIADIQNTTITTLAETAGVSALVFREGVQVSIRQSTVLGPNANGLYVDDGASLVADDLYVGDAELALLALNAGDITVKNSTFEGYRQQGVAIEGARSASIDAVQAEGVGQSIGLRGDIEMAVLNNLVLSTSDPDVPTLFMGTTGGFSITDTSASGGYAPLYIQGSGSGPRTVTKSDFAQGSLAAAVLQQASPATEDSVIEIRDSYLLGRAEAFGLLLDRTSQVKLENSTIMGTDVPSISVYEGAFIEAHNTIVASGAPDVLVGDATSTLDKISHANTVESGIDFTAQSVAEIYAVLKDERTANAAKAKQAGQVIAVNNFGLELFGDAVQISATSQQGEEYLLNSAGEPSDLPAGQYQLWVDGAAQDVIEIEPGITQEVEIPDPIHPYLLFQMGKKYYRGRALPLVAPDQMRQNYKARGLIGNSYTFWKKDIYGPLRSNLDAESRQHALVQARALFFANINDALTASGTNDQSPEAASKKSVVQYSAGVLAALGTSEDRDTLLGMMPEAASLYRTIMIEVATLIEARLGAVGQSVVWEMAQEVQLANPILAIELATHLGALGHPDATEAVLSAMSQSNYNSSALPFNIKTLTFALLARSADPRVLALFRDTLSDYRTAVATALDGEPMRYTSSTGLDFYMMPLVMEYLAVYGTDQDWLDLSVPIAGFFGMDTSIAGLLQDPLPLYLDHIGVSPRPQEQYSHASYIAGYGRLICRSIERRSQQARDAFLNAAMQLSGPKLNEKFYSEDPDRAWIVGEAVTQVTSSYCNPNMRVAEALRRRPHDLEIFPQGELALSWGARRVLADGAIASFDPQAGFVNMRPFANISHQDLLAVTQGDARFATDSGRALVLHHRVIDLRYIPATPDVYPSGSVSRVFVTPIAKTNAQAVLSGRVDLRPIIQNGRLLAGLRLRIAYDESNGLAAQISRRGVMMAEAMQDGARNMIQAVRIRVGDTIIPMTHDQSTKGNIHVFAADLPPSGLNDLVVEVDLEVLDEKWDMVFPLYASDFAYRTRKGQL